MSDRESSQAGAAEYADIFVGQTVECHVCGTRVTAVIEPNNNLTVLRAEDGTPCIDGDTRHPWPN